ncbi:hypothetical protein AHAS_Ahas16G0245000 [Arachis hypogaea]
MLKIDRVTSVHSRERFARICVELDLSKKLVPRISVLEKILNVEYEGLHIICFTYGKYGHRSDQCSETHDGSRGANYKKDSPSNLEAKTFNRSRFNILDEGITEPSHEENVHEEYCGEESMQSGLVVVEQDRSSKLITPKAHKKHERPTQSLHKVLRPGAGKNFQSNKKANNNKSVLIGPARMNKDKAKAKRVESHILMPSDPAIIEKDNSKKLRKKP